jgi:hypothetical protein
LGNAVIYSSTGQKEKVSYCEACLKVRISSPLKHRIYLDENGKITNPQSDADKWKQCWTCGLIVGVYEAKPEVELDTLTEPRANPFKFKSGQVMTGESRKVDRSGKTQRKKKFKQDLEQYKEEDVKEALRKGKKLISYSSMEPLQISSSSKIYRIKRKNILIVGTVPVMSTFM